MTSLGKPQPTAVFIRSILDYDPASGIFTWRFRPDTSRRWNSRYAGKAAGCVGSNGYIFLTIGKSEERNSFNYAAHRIAWVYMTGEWPKDQVDHANGVRTDNRWANLREASASDNATNKRAQSNNKSGFVGVCWSKQAKAFQARINRGGKCIWRKFFPDAEWASQAREREIQRIRDEFAPASPEDRPRYIHARDRKRGHL